MARRRVDPGLTLPDVRGYDPATHSLQTHLGPHFRPPAAGAARYPQGRLFMFAASSPLRRASFPILLALAAAALIGLVGCGGEKVVDPYRPATLEAVMAGADSVLSPNFLYQIEGPQLYYASGDVAIIQKGNMMQFLVGPDLEHSYVDQYQGHQLGVQKRFTDRGAGNNTTHLFLMGVREGEMMVRVDSVKTYTLPSVIKLTQEQIQTPGANLNDLNFRRYTTFENLLPKNEGDKLIPVQTMVTDFRYVPRHDLSEEMKANPGPADYAWYFLMDGCTLQVVNLAPGTQYMLELLKAKDLPLVGSFSLVSVPDKLTERSQSYGDLTHVSGTIQINWFKFANTAIRGS